MYPTKSPRDRTHFLQVYQPVLRLVNQIRQSSTRTRWVFVAHPHRRKRKKSRTRRLMVQKSGQTHQLRVVVLSQYFQGLSTIPSGGWPGDFWIPQLPVSFPTFRRCSKWNHLNSNDAFFICHVCLPGCFSPHHHCCRWPQHVALPSLPQWSGGLPLSGRPLGWWWLPKSESHGFMDSENSYRRHHFFTTKKCIPAYSFCYTLEVQVDQMNWPR